MIAPVGPYCYRCGGSIRLMWGRGRTVTMRGQKGFPVPDTMQIPTCSHCAEMHFRSEDYDRLEVERVDRIARGTWEEVRTRHARHAGEAKDVAHPFDLSVLPDYVRNSLLNPASDDVLELPDALGVVKSLAKRPAWISVREAARWLGMTDHEAWEKLGFTEENVASLQQQERERRFKELMRHGLRQCRQCGSIFGEKLQAEVEIAELGPDRVNFSVALLTDCGACGSEIDGCELTFIRRPPSPLADHLRTCGKNGTMEILQSTSAWVHGGFGRVIRRSMTIRQTLACACGWTAHMQTDISVTQNGMMRASSAIEVVDPPWSTDTAEEKEVQDVG